MRSIRLLAFCAEKDTARPRCIAIFLQPLQKVGWAQARNLQVEYPVYPFREFAKVGGLSAYGVDMALQFGKLRRMLIVSSKVKDSATSRYRPQPSVN
jgi:hypothetical protein